MWVVRPRSRSRRRRIASTTRCLDDAAAKAVNGVRQIVRLDDAVAVVADHMGAAKKGLAARAMCWPA